MSASGRLVEDEAWVTLATDDTYALGALVLAHSLQRVGTCRKLVVLITPGVTSSMRESLSRTFDLVQLVNVMDSGDSANLSLLTRPELGITFTKLHCWRLTQYKKCVFLDADTLVVSNCDELFERDEFSAAPDVGWPDCFNSGVFVFRPSDETYQAFLQCALTTGSFDGGDQGLLNIFFSDWATKDIAKHLPFIYNMTSSVAYSYLPAYVYFGKDVKIVHFIGPIKPWNHRFNTMTGKVEPTPGAFHALEHLQFWWDIFMQDVQGQLQPGLAGLAGQLALITLGQEMTPEQKALEDRARQFSWEQGQIDYLGTDAFANIQRKLDESLNAQVSASQTAPTATEKPDASLQGPPLAEEIVPLPESVSSASREESGEVAIAKTDVAGSEPVSSTPLRSSEVSLDERAISEPVKSTESEVRAEVVETEASAAAIVTDPPPSVPIPVPDRPTAQPTEQKQPLTPPGDPSLVSKEASIASEVKSTCTDIPSKPTPPPSSPVVVKPSTPPVSATQSVKRPPLKQVAAAPAPASPPATAAPAPASPPATAAPAPASPPATAAPAPASPPATAAPAPASPPATAAPAPASPPATAAPVPASPPAPAAPVPASPPAPAAPVPASPPAPAAPVPASPPAPAAPVPARPPAPAAPAPVSPPPAATATAAAVPPVGPSKRSSPKVASPTSATAPKTVGGSESSKTSPLAAASTKPTESRSAAAAPTKQPKGTKKPKSP